MLRLYLKRYFRCFYSQGNGIRAYDYDLFGNEVSFTLDDNPYFHVEQQRGSTDKEFIARLTTANTLTRIENGLTLKIIGTVKCAYFQQIEYLKDYVCRTLELLPNQAQHSSTSRVILSFVTQSHHNSSSRCMKQPTKPQKLSFPSRLTCRRTHTTKPSRSD